MKKPDEEWTFLTPPLDKINNASTANTGSKELSSPIEENRVFHALTTAYEKSHQVELFTSTQNIVQKERELAEQALLDLQKMTDGNSASNDTVRLLVEHYQNRLAASKQKDGIISKLGEDSRHMLEEYKQKNQELVEVKRSLIEAQSRMRELSKNIERLSKKEEELRFIESSLAKELQNNKTSVINELYEIVIDLNESRPSQSIPAVDVTTSFPVMDTNASGSKKQEKESPTKPGDLSLVSEHFKKGLPAEEAPKSLPDIQVISEVNNTRSKLGSSSDALEYIKFSELLSSAEYLRIHEPPRIVCARSHVKNAEGEIISEFFYSPNCPKNERHYVYNILHCLLALLKSRLKGDVEFNQFYDLVWQDLQTRMNQNLKIHFEVSVNEVCNKEAIENLRQCKREDRSNEIAVFIQRVLAKLQALGRNREENLVTQIRNYEKDSTISAVQ